MMSDILNIHLSCDFNGEWDDGYSLHRKEKKEVKLLKENGSKASRMLLLTKIDTFGWIFRQIQLNIELKGSFADIWYKLIQNVLKEGPLKKCHIGYSENRSELFIHYWNLLLKNDNILMFSHELIEVIYKIMLFYFINRNGQLCT